ncbi:MAG: Phage portal protein [Tenericutes bacterium ADurb.Bin239]|jgi:HK97 family phage portal protein|nr:MAG: Phage portal protein [Tenericutes bacterium ADurb.Bin239]
MSIFDVFKRKKKVVAPSPDDAQLFKSTLNLFTDFGDNINLSDVVKICIDRIATHSAKLKPRYVKSENKETIQEKNGNLAYLLKHQPNPLMIPFDFIYKIVTLLYLNNNAFVYPVYDDETYELKELWPIKPNSVEALKDDSGALYLRFYFTDKKSFTLPYESIIHLKRFYGVNDIFGGSGAISDHSALLKTIKINDSVLQGLDNAIKTSFQVKGLLKINGILSEKDKSAQKREFDEALKEATKEGGSSIVPVDLKSEYVPLNVDPKLIDSETLSFLQKKIISYFGVSEPIFDNKYDENQYNAFYESVIEGVAIALSEAFSKALLTRSQLEKGEQIIFYSERLQYASWNTKVQAIEKLMGLGILSLNESRALLGFEPVEGGSKRLQSLNYVDADKAADYQLKNDIFKKPKEDSEDEQ